MDGNNNESLVLFNSTTGEPLGRQSESSYVGPNIALMNSQNLIDASRSIVIREMDKKNIMINVNLAYKELVVLSTTIEPLWEMSQTNRGYVLNRKEYSKRFRKSPRHMTNTSFRIESSKDSTLVHRKASDLAGMFLDMNQWVDLFATIVREAKILKALDTGTGVGFLHLMYGRMHILSPLVAPREFIFFRHCVRPSPDTWFIVDVSYDYKLRIQDSRPTLSWRFPSGVMIQSLSDTQSKVTWVEHVKVNGSLDHPLYEDLLSTAHGYGATRWVHTLRGMCERTLYSEISRSTRSYKLDGVMNILEGRENFMTLSLRMIRHFCSILSMPGNLSESSSPSVRMSVRNSNEPGHFRGFIVAASTSIRLPLIFENLFNFLRDENRRPEWDVMNERTSVFKVAHMSTGTHPGNSVSIIQPSMMKKEKLCLLQECSINPVGALVIFTLLDLLNIMETENGKDTGNIPLLPWGFLISNDGASTSKTPGSLLTLALQWLILDNSESMQNAAADTLNSFVTSIIHDISVALGCPQLDR